MPLVAGVGPKFPIKRVVSDTSAAVAVVSPLTVTAIYRSLQISMPLSVSNISSPSVMMASALSDVDTVTDTETETSIPVGF
jgi:hypothetical protein